MFEGICDVMLSRLLQPLNAAPPMDVTPLGILMLLRLLQPLNVEVSIVVMLFGISILVRLLQL